MNKLERPPPPAPLVEHGSTWAKAFCERRAREPGERFRWATHRGRPVNQLLLEPLRAMTQAHCAYCDGFPISTTGLETYRFMLRDV
ncbi:hypothetical protein L6R52_19435 [Myxococcota bacterium]|nr:hypothetical protein [Myxococcota bacterium]